MASKTVGVRIPVDVNEELERVAAKHGQSVTQFLRQLIDDTLFPPKSKGETAALLDESTPKKANEVGIDKLHKEIETLSDMLEESNAADYENLKKLAEKVDGLAELHGELSDALPTLNDRVVKLEQTVGALHSDYAILRENLSESLHEQLKEHERQLDWLFELVDGHTKGGKLSEDAVKAVNERVNLAIEQSGALFESPIEGAKPRTIIVFGNKRYPLKEE
jgi:archaellum component FlaC